MSSLFELSISPSSFLVYQMVFFAASTRALSKASVALALGKISEHSPERIFSINWRQSKESEACLHDIRVVGDEKLTKKVKNSIKQNMNRGEDPNYSRSALSARCVVAH